MIGPSQTRMAGNLSKDHVSFARAIEIRACRHEKQPLTARWGILNICHYNKANSAIINRGAPQNDRIKTADFLSIGDPLPPDTGASMNTAPIFSAATAISFETAGSMVEESIKSVPFFTFLKRARQKALSILSGAAFLFLH